MRPALLALMLLGLAAPARAQDPASPPFDFVTPVAPGHPLTEAGRRLDAFTGTRCGVIVRRTTFLLELLRSLPYR